MDVQPLVLQHGDVVVTLAEEYQDFAGLHSVVLHYVHYEEEVAPVMMKSWYLSMLLIFWSFR